MHKVSGKLNINPTLQSIRPYLPEKIIILQNQTLDRMTPISRLSCLIAVLSLLFVISCQKEVKTDIPGPGPGTGGTGTTINPTPVQGTVTGKVVDNNNNAVAGATVRAGTSTTTTDNRGLFRFNKISLDKYASLVTVEKSGFFKAYRVFSASANNTNFVRLKLIPKMLIGSVDASTGGSIDLPDN